MSVDQRTLSIGDVARHAGVNVQTLRYYERRGLVQPLKRGASGRRQYVPDSVTLIRFIKRAQDLGFSLNEVRELIALRRTRSRNRSRVRRIASAKLADIEAKIQRLSAMRRAVTGLVKACGCGDRELNCPILEALDDEAPPRKAVHSTNQEGGGRA